MTAKKSTILLVDDRPANILALEKLLEKRDRVFLAASSGEEALKIALNRDIDLIILDVQMPNMDGFEVSQLLKSNKRTRDTPIIFASAEKKEHEFIMKGFEEGAIDYLHKPLDPEITRAKVSVLLKLQQQRKELIEKNISLERCALLINNSADIIGIVDETTLKFEEVNRAFTTILGYAQEEVLNMSIDFFLSNEDRTRVRKLRDKAAETISFETRVYCKDRSIKWLQWNVVIKNEKWFINARDITLVKQVEKIRNYLATIVKQSDNAIYIHDLEGKIIAWNDGAERIYGYSEPEALSMGIWNLIPEYLQEEKQQIIKKIVQGQTLSSFESKRITKHGKVLDVLVSASVITDAENNTRSIAITERDITLQKIANEQILQLNADLKQNVLQLENTNKELESFSYSVSHDLRAPLRSIIGYAQMLEDGHGKELDANAKRLLGVVQKNAAKMSDLIDSLLEFSRLGKKEIKKSRVDVKQLVQAALDDIRNSSPHHASIQIKSLLPVMADYTLLNQVWINLISNAIKYSSKKEKPVVEIGSYAEEDEVIYYVKDNGAGFDMAYANKLFGVFQRLHGPKEFEGTGIGLAIIQRVIVKHGGRVWAEAEVNKGATFYFVLPNNRE